MRYSFGQSLGDYGFAFYEKLHEPVFLVNSTGEIRQANRAARKFMRVAHPSANDIRILREQIPTLFKDRHESCKRLRLGDSGLQLIARKFNDSEYILVEVRH